MILTAKREEATFVTEEKSEIHAFAEKLVSNVSMPKL